MTITGLKIIVTSLVALSFAASLAGDAEAAKKKRLVASQYSQPYAEGYGYRGRGDSGYYEQRLQTLPVGSQQWWSVYDRERGGRR